VTPRIQSLPDEVVNRIAAGEVVERPASVLKELLENAVDSGAATVDAGVTGPFPFTLRVTDDGCGMTREEAELAVRRHTTSKIASADDLERRCRRSARSRVCALSPGRAARSPRRNFWWRGVLRRRCARRVRPREQP
jgi:hypothetical protein